MLQKMCSKALVSGSAISALGELKLKLMEDMLDYPLYKYSK